MMGRPLCIWGGDGVAGDQYYSSGKHREWRRKVLRRAGYLCEECRRYGRVDEHGQPPAAVIAHHIIPRETHPELQYKVDNGQALCKRCHNIKHPEKGGARW